MIEWLAHGVILRLVPYLTAIPPLLPPMQRAPVPFKTIMIAESAFVVAVSAALYFLGVSLSCWREGLVLSAVWLALSWALDL